MTYHEQFTNSVHSKLNTGDMILLAIETRKEDCDYLSSDEKILADKINSKIKRGELLTDSDKIALANYMLEYFTDYQDIAKRYFDILDSAIRKED